MISKAIQITGAVLLTLLMATAHAGTVAVTDDDGRQLTLPGPAKRIVSLAPHITELLFAAGAGDRIVGTVEYSDYPEPAKQIERIGNHSAIDMERLAALQPDLIIAWQSGNPKQALKKLEQMGYTLFYSEPRTIDDIASTMIRFAT
ncbi:MAG: helical backbone metal receptor, partial [Gammaproteobacteria bacterium]